MSAVNTANVPGNSVTSVAGVSLSFVDSFSTAQHYSSANTPGVQTTTTKKNDGRASRTIQVRLHTGGCSGEALQHSLYIAG
jgi:hypothetical protein